MLNIYHIIINEYLLLLLIRGKFYLTLCINGFFNAVLYRVIIFFTFFCIFIWWIIQNAVYLYYTKTEKQIDMTYEIAQQIANGNQETLYKTFASMVKMAQESGMSLNEAKREAKAMLNCMVNAWNKSQKM